MESASTQKLFLSLGKYWCCYIAIGVRLFAQTEFAKLKWGKKLLIYLSKKIVDVFSMYPPKLELDMPTSETEIPLRPTQQINSCAVVLTYIETNPIEF